MLSAWDMHHDLREYLGKKLVELILQMGLREQADILHSERSPRKQQEGQSQSLTTAANALLAEAGAGC